jgi:hypothetical protein
MMMTKMKDPMKKTMMKALGQDQRKDCPIPHDAQKYRNRQIANPPLLCSWGSTYRS